MTCGARPSTAASPTNRPPIVLSRTSAIRVGAGAGSAARAAVACSSSVGHRSSAPAGHAEPRRPHGARVGGHPLDVLRHAAVLRDGPADEDAREDGGRGGDPERGGERAGATAPQPGEREADDVPRAGHDGCSRRRLYARAFSRPPQTCIEHQLDERLREPS